MPTQTPQANRQWLLSKLLNVSPFSEEILKLNRAQMEWIIAKYGEDNPDALKFTSTMPSTMVESLVKWNEVLTGKALSDWLKTRVPTYRRDDLEIPTT